MYKVVFTQRALKDLENIDKEVRNRIATKLKECTKEPLIYARKLSNPKIGTYRFRVGDYRVIFDIDKKHSDFANWTQKEHLQMIKLRFTGNYYTRDRVERLKRDLEKVGLGGRVDMFMMSASYGA